MAFGTTPNDEFCQLLSSLGEASASAPPDPATDLSPPRLERQRAVWVKPPPGLTHTIPHVPPETLPGLPAIPEPRETRRLPGEEIPFGGNESPEPLIPRQEAGEPPSATEGAVVEDSLRFTLTMDQCADILREFASPVPVPPQAAHFALKGVIRAIKQKAHDTTSVRSMEFTQCANALEEITGYFCLEHVFLRTTFAEVAETITRRD
jgi:hypothetical protein